MYSIILTAIGVYLMSSSPSWAYLDPGMGNIALQGIIAALATLSMSVTLGWRYIKTTVASLRDKLSGRTSGASSKNDETAP